jgi:WD40 repeat protein
VIGTNVRELLFTILFSCVCASVSGAQPERHPLQIGDADAISALSWSPNDDLILTASGGENALRLWDVAGERVLWERNTGFLQDGLELHSIRRAEWTEDEKLIVTGTDNGKIQLWDAANGRLIWNIKAHADAVAALSISPDAKRIVSASGGVGFESELKVWSLDDGKLLKDLGEGRRDVRAVGFIDVDHFQAADGFGQVTTWSADGFKVVAVRQLPPCGLADKKRHDLVYSPSLSFMAAHCRKYLVITSVATGKVFKRIPDEEQNSRPVYSRDEKVLFLTDSTESVFLDADGKRVKGFEDSGGGVLNSDGRLLAAFPSYRADGVQIIETRGGRRRGWLVGHPGAIKSLAFSPDGSRFASGSADRVVRVWDTKSRKILFSLEGHTRPVESVEFSADGKSLTSRSEKETIVWNTENATKLREIKEARRFEDDWNRSLSPSGRLALVEESEKPFRLMDARTGATIKEFVYIDQLDNLVFGPDEEHFLAKPWWGGWQLWSVKGGEPIREFDVGYSYYNRVAFHPDGRMFVTGGAGQNIFMFDLGSGETLWSLFPIDREEFAEKRAAEARRVASISRGKENAKLADIENARYKDRVYITFDHYGDMTPPDEQRMTESAEPKKSKAKRAAADASALWLRLHNDSPLPVSVPTQSMYFGGAKCYFEFPTGQKVFGLCDGSEISVWLALEDKSGEPLRYGFDFGSSVILLPKTSLLFAVPRRILADGNTITFGFTFRKPTDGKEVGDYGNAVTLRFRESDLPK